MVTVDENGRVFFSCRRSTVQFVGSVLLSGFLLVFVLRVLVKLGLGFRARFGGNKQKFVVRRDRSLGGKEVVVAVGEEDGRTKFSSKKILDSPLSPGRTTRGSGIANRVARSYPLRNEDKLPEWWPVTVAEEDRDLVVEKEEYQREANRLIRGQHLCTCLVYSL